MQFVKDNTGAATAVIIPIKEWKQIISKHQDLKQLEQRLTMQPEKKLKPSDYAGSLSEEGYEALKEHIKQAQFG